MIRKCLNTKSRTDDDDDGDDDDDDDNNNVLIDVAISGDINLIKNEAEKTLKYKDLTTQIQRMRNVKTKVITVIIEATATISKSRRQYLSNLLENNEIKEPQKRATEPHCALHTNCWKC